MKYCTKCVMPDTRPGVFLDDNGVCNACRHAEYKKTVDWKARKKEFGKLCDKYRRKGHEYDCLIAVSSGKDSYYQINLLKNEFNMNPLLVNVWNLDWTKTGLENWEKMLSVFGVDSISLHLNRELNRKMTRIGFEHDGFPAWMWDRCVYTYPIQMAIRMNIPLVIYGENVNIEYGGHQTKETPSALEQINNDVSRDYGWGLWTKNGISMNELNMAQYPTKEEIEKVKLDPRYISYYFNWSGWEHYQVAKKLGFKDLNMTKEWKKEGFVEHYDQIDDFAYQIDPWLKYPKYGHARTTDVCCYWIRDGLISRDEAIPLVRDNDWKIDPTALGNFLDFTGYSEDEFWKIVEKFWNKEIFHKVDGKWDLKNPIWKQEPQKVNPNLSFLSP